jgi:hypothetical protein
MKNKPQREKKKEKKQPDAITIKPTYKHRVPHKPTRAHRSRKKYTRKGKTREQLRKELMSDSPEET